MRRAPDAAEQQKPATDPNGSRASVLPRQYSPRVAGYAGGPFVNPTFVTPTDWTWRNARTFRVEDEDGIEYRCLRVYDAAQQFVGYWVVELLGKPSLPTGWDD